MSSIDFKTKIQRDRIHRTSKGDSLDSLLMQFESDRGRIINSAAIRRLQQKTQVFPLERNAAVRSRLTHSLEVQQSGRFIVQTIFRDLAKKRSSDELAKSYGLDGLERHIESIVEMSCLMHDVGNPPFGHFGEQAINDWFKKNLNSLIPSKESSNSFSFSDDLIRDITQFEGNAQAIRLVHTLLGLNLTYTQVAGIMKYTRCGSEANPSESDPYCYLKKKVGFYISEQNYIQELREKLSIDHNCRHPISYIMEAADDISYGIADLEDAVEKGILDIQQLSIALCDEFKQVCKKFGIKCDEKDHIMNSMTNYALGKASTESNCKTSHFFIYLRVKLNHLLVNYAATRFIENINAIYHGSLNAALLEDRSIEHAVTKTLKNVAMNNAFCHKEVEASELQGYRIISGLLECYKPLLLLERNIFSKLVNGDKGSPLYETRLYKKLPNKHIRAYVNALNPEFNPIIENEKDRNNVWEFYYRIRLIQDYISGMTDQFAFDEYRALLVID